MTPTSCDHFLEQPFERLIANEQVESLEDLEEMMVMEQFINFADKELVSLLKEKSLRH